MRGEISEFKDKTIKSTYAWNDNEGEDGIDFDFTDGSSYRLYADGLVLQEVIDSTDAKKLTPSRNARGFVGRIMSRFSALYHRAL
jgi:hypothetical protein